MKAIFFSVVCVLFISIFSSCSGPGPIELELFDAVKRSDTVSVNRLVEEGANVTVSGKDGINAVFLAARNGSFGILGILIDSIPAEERTEDIVVLSILLDMKNSIIESTENQIPEMRKEIDTELLELNAKIAKTLEKQAIEQTFLREYIDKEKNTAREAEELKAQMKSEIYKEIMSDIIEYGESYFNELIDLNYNPENSGLLKLSDILEEK